MFVSVYIQASLKANDKFLVTDNWEAKLQISHDSCMKSHFHTHKAVFLFRSVLFCLSAPFNPHD